MFVACSAPGRSFSGDSTKRKGSEERLIHFEAIEF